MIALHFCGHFQCRLATDPDPADEPRGVSGFMWAVAGEPDLDRIIRFQDPVAPRSHCPTVGVSVREVVVGGVASPGHPLLGARVELLDEPRFEGRNGIVAQSGTEPIVPFKISVSAGSTALVRDSGVSAQPYDGLRPAGRVSGSRGVIAAATGRWDYAADLAERAKKLGAVRAKLGPPASGSHAETEAAALDSRLANIAETKRFAAVLHDVRLLYAFSLRGQAFAVGDHGLGPVDLKSDWRVEFWLGAWDVDAMTGFVDGWLLVPHDTDTGASQTDEPGAAYPLEYVDFEDE